MNHVVGSPFPLLEELCNDLLDLLYPIQSSLVNVSFVSIPPSRSASARVRTPAFVSPTLPILPHRTKYGSRSASSPGLVLPLFLNMFFSHLLFFLTSINRSLLVLATSPNSLLLLFTTSILVYGEYFHSHSLAELLDLILYANSRADAGGNAIDELRVEIVLLFFFE